MNDDEVERFIRAYEENVSRVYGFFGYRVASREAVEDLTQQTFERALRSWNLFDERVASVGTWLMAIARNILIDSYRGDRSDRERSLDGSEETVPLLDDEPGLGLSAELEAALDRLDQKQRELIALRFGGDLTGPEIAHLTGLSLANVQQILSRSLRRLRVELSAEPGPTQRRDSNPPRFG